jgi:hypothetical protein
LFYLVWTKMSLKRAAKSGAKFKVKFEVPRHSVR